MREEKGWFVKEERTLLPQGKGSKEESNVGGRDSSSKELKDFG